jgi:hypothetical protein
MVTVHIAQVMFSMFSVTVCCRFGCVTVVSACAAGIHNAFDDKLKINKLDLIVISESSQAMKKGATQGKASSIKMNANPNQNIRRCRRWMSDMAQLSPASQR